MPNILELVSPAALTFAAREVPEPVENSLAKILPNREIDGIKTQAVRGTRKRFKAQVAELMRGGNAYFIKNAKGNIVLMAENIKEHDRPLAGFKRRYRKAEGIKRLKRGADIPIAVLVPKVVLKKRIDVERLVAGRIPRLAAAVEKQISTVD